jgi:pimeloyl-ACP methyl ester carboxylesterase
MSSITPRISDLRGLARLGGDGTVGVTDLVEAMHATIAARAGFGGVPPSGRARGITGLVYRAVRGSMRGVGRGIDVALSQVDAPSTGDSGTPEREAVVAALNGLWGDHLAASGNPLAIPMALRSSDGRSLGSGDVAERIPAPRRKLLVLVHGLCMSDRQWLRNGHDHGRMLADEFGFTPLYLHYNSGRHVSTNGREFAMRLEDALARWPVPVDELAIVGHSMGGLVARSACHHAAQSGLVWLDRLNKLVFLGTPHHGAPLERGGRWVDQLLCFSPYVAPLARLGKARSAGITDLRFGNLQDGDWNHRDRHSQHRDDRLPTPLPEGVDCFALAATRAEAPGQLHSAVIGDGLVPVASALGEHADPALALRLPRAHRQVVASCGHIDLLCNAAVQASLRVWLASPGEPRR